MFQIVYYAPFKTNDSSLCIYASKIPTHPMTRKDFSSWKSHNGSRQQLQQWQPFTKVINCSLHMFIVAVYSGCVTQNSFCLKTWGCFKVTRCSEIVNWFSIVLIHSVTYITVSKQTDPALIWYSSYCSDTFNSCWSEGDLLWHNKFVYWWTIILLLFIWLIPQTQ
jgi:hypothetical protein